MMQYRSPIAGIAVAVVIASVLGYTLFLEDSVLTTESDDITPAEDGPDATITRGMPSYATTGSTIIITLDVDAEEPVNATVQEQLQLTDNTIWHNTTLRNIQHDTIWYTLTLPNETGTAEITGQFQGIDETITGGDTIRIVPRDPSPYEPPAVEELLPAEAGAFEQTRLHSDGADGTAEQYAEAVYVDNGDEHTVELWQYTGSATANASMVERADPDGEPISFYDGQTPAYRTSDTLLWTKGPFLYRVDDPNADELAFALIEVNRG